jgi:hypothetical protein
VVSLGDQFLAQRTRVRILCCGKNTVSMEWRSQLPNRDVLLGLLLIVVLVLLLWFFGIVEFDVGRRRWQ